MVPLIAKSVVAIAAVAGLAMSSDQPGGAAYDQKPTTSLTAAAVANHAEIVFARSDVDRDGALSADEFTALSIVTAELARLNGFLTVETGFEPQLISLPATERSLTQIEQITVAATAKARFYQAAGEDAALSQEEFTQIQQADFKNADLNGNQRLARHELLIFANRTAQLVAES